MFGMRILGAAMVISAFALPSAAAPLFPGGVIFPTGTTSAADPNQAGAIINDNLINASTGGLQPIQYNVQNRVVRSDALGSLIFSPRIRDPFNFGGFGLVRFEVIAFTLEGFAGIALTDVDFRTDGLGDKGPTSVSRSFDGDLMTFRYADPLFNDAVNPPGVRDESLFPVITTNATEFDFSGVMTIFGRVEGADDSDPLVRIVVTGLAAPSQVPAPASAFLLVGAIAALRLFGRRSAA